MEWNVTCRNKRCNSKCCAGILCQHLNPPWPPTLSCDGTSQHNKRAKDRRHGKEHQTNKKSVTSTGRRGSKARSKGNFPIWISEKSTVVTDEFPKLNGSLGSGFIGHSRSVSTTRVYTKIRQNSAIDRLVDWCSGYHVCFTKSVQISTLFISQQVPGSIPGSIIFCFFRVSFYFFFFCFPFGSGLPISFCQLGAV